MRKLVFVALFVAAVVGLWRSIGSKGKIGFVAPGYQSITVYVDGKKRYVSKGTWELVEVKPGKHEVIIDRDGERTTQTVDLPTAEDRLVVPVFEGQCFAVLDMTGAYVKKGAPATTKVTGPRIIQRLTGAGPHFIPQNTFYGSVPRETTRESINWLRDMPCDALSQTDDQVIGTALAGAKLQ